MTGVRVVSAHVGSLPHVVYKQIGILVADCFDYVLDFFVFTDQSNKLFNFIWPCGEVDYKFDSIRISVTPKVPSFLQYEIEVISIITCET